MPLLQTRANAASYGYGFLQYKVTNVAGPYYMGYYGWSNASISALAYQLGLDSSGNIYTTLYNGTTTKNTFLKLNSSLAISSQKEITDSLGSSGYTSGASIDSSNNANIAYCSGSYGSTTLLKISSSDTITFSKSLTISSNINAPWCVFTDSSGNIYACGRADDASANQRGFVAKWNSSGVLQWQNAYPATGSYCVFYAITATASGVYVAGSSTAGSSNYLVKLDPSTGSVTWTASYYDNTTYKNGEWQSIVLDSSENVYVAGRLCPVNGYYDVAFAKYNSSGTLQWAKRYVENGATVSNERAYTIQITPDNSYIYVAGQYYSSAISNSLAFIVKASTSSGAFQWGRFLRSNNNTTTAIFSLACDNNQFYCTGNLYDGTYTKLFVAKLPGDGTKTGTYTLGSFTMTYSVMSAPTEVTTSTTQSVTTTVTANPLTAGTPTTSLANSTGSMTVTSAL